MTSVGSTPAQEPASVCPVVGLRMIARLTARFREVVIDWITGWQP